MLSLRFGLGWAKSHSLHTGQTPVLKYNRQLMQAILWGRLPIGDIVKPYSPNSRASAAVFPSRFLLPAAADPLTN